MSECTKKYPDESSDVYVCEQESVHYADVALPIKIKPYASIGEVETECCGDAIITSKNPNYCHSCSPGCAFVITQKLKITIPIAYGTDLESDDASITCHHHPIKPCE